MLRARPMLPVTMILVLLLALVACTPAPEEELGGDEAIEEERVETAVEEGEVPAETGLVEEASGIFTLTLTGDLEERLEGSALCVVEKTDDELRITLQPDTGGLDHRFPYMLLVGVPGYGGTGSYSGAFRITGPERSSGSLEVAVARIPAADVVLERDFKVRFEGSFTGAAGTGSVEGSVDCHLPDGG